MSQDGIFDESYDPSLTQEPRNTDAGNAIRFAKMWYQDVIYVPEAKAWYVWNGKAWAEDKGDVEMLRMAKRTIDRLFVTAAAQTDQDLRNGQIKWAMASESQPRLLAMIQSAKSLCRTFKYSDFDADPWLFNAANCTIDLRTGKARKHHRDDFLTKISPVDYDTNAMCPRWSQFLNEILPGHEHCCVPFLQRAIGYTLTGRINEECFFVCWGPRGRNGKSKFIETVRHVLGDYGKVASFDTFVARKGDEKLNDVAGFRGARLIVASESEHSKRLAEAKIKRMTGDEAVTGEFKYQEQFSYVPTYKIWLVTNAKPKVVGTDNAIWDRTHLIPFNRYFSENERDPNLGEKLKSESSGVLNWVIEGCLEWQKQTLNVPPCVREATNEYRAEQDVLRHFIEDRCLVGTDRWAGKQPMYDAYKAWAERMGEFVMPFAEFTERFQLQFEEGRSGPRGRHWKGVAVRSDSEFEQLSTADQEQVVKAIQ
jgi:putative DNA primase/helicase